MFKRSHSIPVVLTVGLCLSAGSIAVAGGGEIPHSHEAAHEGHGAHAGHGAHQGHAGHGHHGSHPARAIDGEGPIPTLSARVTPDAVRGYNLSLTVDHFQFVPERAGSNHVPGEGHAHLYVDGVKRARVYSPQFHLGDLEPGRHTVRVTLNGNDHTDLTLHGAPIEAVTVVVVPDDALEGTPTEMSRREVTTPGVEVLLEQDPVAGWNLYMDRAGFQFTSPREGVEGVNDAGYARLYVDGQELGRIYGRSYHVSKLSPGTHELRVRLHGADHAPLEHDGRPLEGTVTVHVPSPTDADHAGHGSHGGH